MRAQRLSASEVEELLIEENYKLQLLVLNAFRHQRLKNNLLHPTSRRLHRAQRLSASEVEELAILGQALTDPPVLNAFRHQRLKNLVGSIGMQAFGGCSTPFGIRG